MWNSALALLSVFFYVDVPKSITSRQTNAILAREIVEIQRALCVNESGELDSATRGAIREYFAARGVPYSIISEQIIMANGPLLGEAIRDVESCILRGYRNAFEVAVFGVPAQNSAEAISKFQRDLSAYLERRGAPEKVMITGKLDTQTRRAITSARRELSLSGSSDEINEELYRGVVRG
jgi:hypothetical protein